MSIQQAYRRWLSPVKRAETVRNTEIDADAFVVIGQGHQARGGMVRPSIMGAPEPGKTESNAA